MSGFSTVWQSSLPGRLPCRQGCRLRLRYLVLAKFLPGVDRLAAGLAGAVPIRSLSFLLYAAAGTLLWAGAWIRLGYLCADVIGLVEARIEVRQLDMAYGARIIQRDLTFTVRRGDTFIIMGGSGCGKSALLRHLIGLLEPAGGQVLYDGRSFWGAEADERERMTRRFGVLPSRGANRRGDEGWHASRIRRGSGRSWSEQ
jgi:hypothetical protein